MQTNIYKYDIVEYVNFLTPEECDSLIRYYESVQETWQETCFFNTRVMDPNEGGLRLIAGSIDTNKIGDIHHKIAYDNYFEYLKLRLKDAAESVFNREVKNLTLSAHKWLPGSYAADHYDNAELDGTPNAWQNNKLVTIIYLNDNYRGGNLTFSEHGLSIAPKKGSMIVFDVGVSNLHGVSEVLSGERYTMLASWDWADSVYPEGYLDSLMQDREKEKEKQNKQKKEWKNQQKYKEEAYDSKT